jgi:hypothetical protein
MANKKWGFALIAIMLLACVSGFAQQTAVRGNLAGTVSDPTGAVIPGAKVTAVGSQDTRSATTDAEGRFTIQGLNPGRYDLKVEKEGFKVADLKAVEVVIGKTASLRLAMNPGLQTETVEVTANSVTVDPTSTAVSTNLTNEFYSNVPVQRGVANIFYAAPGVSSGLGTGNANPSISGGTGLENNYIADGVQINDAAFGGLGVYSRVYGSIGTGINLSFIKEVQVKTAGFEPQYGKSTGGVIQIVTKSGTRDFHGGFSAFAAPVWAEKERLHPDDFGRANQFGKNLHARNYDLTGELSGYVPGFREHMFFYGSFNPSWAKTNNQIASNLWPTLQGVVPNFERRQFSKNYAGKLTFKLNESHQIEASVFGDPTGTNMTGNRNRAFINPLVFSKYDFQGRNLVTRYNGTWSPTWLFNAAFTWNHNDFTETPLADVYNFTNETETLGLPGQRGLFTAQGIGFQENYDSDNYGINFDTSKTVNFGGTHTFLVGYNYTMPHYNALRQRTGARFGLFAANANGVSMDDTNGTIADPANAGLLTDATFRLRTRAACTACKLLNVPGVGLTPVAFQQNRGEFEPPLANTEGRTHVAFFNDTYSINKYLTLALGARWEKQELIGRDAAFQFPSEWSPRVGVIVDPWGDRRTKFSANFSRLFFHVPLDMAIRNLSVEKDAGNYWFNGVDANADGILDLDANGNPQPDISLAGLLNSMPGTSGISARPTFSISDVNSVRSGTRMQYTDEWSAGFERDMGKGVIVGARYVDRRLKRVIEDIAGVSPEGFNAGLTQNYFITNVNSTTDLFVNENPLQVAIGSVDTDASGVISPAELAAGCPAGSGAATDPVQDANGTNVGAVCFQETAPGSGLFGGEIGADGIADGFANPSRIYRAVEIEVNKGFSAGWLLRANYRVADLKGNYEGAFRNDNGQSDPSVSSLFDFTQGTFGLLGNQFAIGSLNTDRRHTINGFASYTFAQGMLKNLTIGSGVRVQSGFPLSALAAHPAYQNSGEVPIGGRGSLGRSAVTTQVDFNLGYLASISEKQRLRFGIDMFNVGNRRTLFLIDQTRDIQFGTPNVDFGLPGDRVNLGANSFQRPFNARFNVKWEF